MTKYDTAGAFEKLREDPFLPAAPAPRKSRKGWVIAGLLVAAVGIGGAVNEGSVADDLGRDAAPVIEETIDDGLVSFDGISVDQMADFVIGTSEHDTLCELTPAVGYDESRQMYLDAEPQLGSDTYEGAVFDAMMAAC